MKDIIAPEILLQGYARGVFPMADSRDADDVEWYTAHRRGVIPLDQFHVSSNVRRQVRNHHYEVRFDTAFREAMVHCANRRSTWISDLIINSYEQLHELGHAHSVEVYSHETGQMVGGLYGVSLQAAFFGESMFNYERETAKIALYYCHRALVEGGFTLWDTQFYTEHLGRFGCVEIEADDYALLLEQAMRKKATFRFPEKLDSGGK